VKRKLLTPVNIAAAVLALAFLPRAFKTIQDTVVKSYEWGYQELIVRPQERRLERERKEREVRLIKIKNEARTQYYKLLPKAQNLRTEFNALKEKSSYRAILNLLQKSDVNAKSRCIVIEREEPLLDACRFNLPNGEHFVVEGDRGQMAYYAWYLTSREYANCVVDREIFRGGKDEVNQPCGKLLQLRFLSAPDEKNLKARDKLQFDVSDKWKEVEESKEKLSRLCGLAEVYGCSDEVEKLTSFN